MFPKQFIILEYLNEDDQVNICKLVDGIEITTLTQIHNYKINNRDLIKFTKLKTLNLSDNNTITDNDIKHMNLHTLDLDKNNTITYNGIKHMKLL
jgi:hypothetical protein